jgi:hypothetical protein
MPWAGYAADGQNGDELVTGARRAGRSSMGGVTIAAPASATGDLHAGALPAGAGAGQALQPERVPGYAADRSAGSVW